MAHTPTVHALLATSILGIIGDVRSQGDVWVLGPPNGIDDTAAFQNAISGSTETTPTLITFAHPGTYRFGPVAGDAQDPLFEIHGFTDLQITAVAGVTIELFGYDRVKGSSKDIFELSGCNSVTISGADATNPLVFDMEPSSGGSNGLPWFQGTLHDIDLIGGFATIRITDPDFYLPSGVQIAEPWSARPFINGYPHAERTVWGAAHSGVILPAPPPMATHQDVTLSYAASASARLSTWATGDRIVVSLGDSEQALFQCRNLSGIPNSDLEFTNIEVRCFAGKTLMLGNTHGVTLDNYNVRPASTLRKLSSVRDGVSGRPTGEVVIRNCEFKKCGDDAIQMGSQPVARVVSYDALLSQAVIALATPAGQQHPNYKPGWAVEARPASWSRSNRETATILSVQNSGAQQTLTLLNETPGFAAVMKPDALLFAVSQNWSSCLVDSCVIKSVRGGGIKLRNGPITIRNSQIFKTTSYGIFLGGGTPSAGSKYPLGGNVYPPDSSEITNCDIQHAGPRGNIHPSMHASVYIGVADDVVNGQWQNPTASCDVITNVLVQNNRFISDRTYARGGLYCHGIGGATGLQLVNNDFQDLGDSTTSNLPWQYGVYTSDCVITTDTGNTYTNCYKPSFFGGCQ